MMGFTQIIFSLGGISIWLIILFIFGRDLYAYLFFETVQSRVNSISVTPKKLGSHSQTTNDTWYVIRVSYTYEYSGQKFTGGNYLSFGSKVLPAHSKSKRYLEWIVSKKINFTNTVVYVNKKKPDESIWMPFFWSELYLFFIFSAVLITWMASQFLINF